MKGLKRHIQKFVDSMSIESQTAVVLVWWHFSLLLPTLFFKNLYLREVYNKTIWRIGLRTIIESLGEGAQRYFSLVLLASIDILEVSIAIGIFFVVGRLLLRASLKGLMIGSLSLCLLIMAANHLSVRQVGVLPTVDTAALSASWIRGHPHVLWDSVGPLKLSFLGLAVLWSFAFPILLIRRVRGNGISPKFMRHCHRFLLAFILIGSLLGCIGWWRVTASAPVPLRGYWSSTFITFLKLDKPKLLATSLPALATIKS